jgi:hypothetical protein
MHSLCVNNSMMQFPFCVDAALQIPDATWFAMLWVSVAPAHGDFAAHDPRPSPPWCCSLAEQLLDSAPSCSLTQLQQHELTQTDLCGFSTAGVLWRHCVR